MGFISHALGIDDERYNELIEKINSSLPEHGYESDALQVIINNCETKTEVAVMTNSYVRSQIEKK